jgi:pSer/pThr/pTyr-binding forkhead associated (FHA) protein
MIFHSLWLNSFHLASELYKIVEETQRTSPRCLIVTEQNKQKPQKFSTDWLFRGVLTKLGETFDRLTGRNWKPSSSLATSELIEKIKQILDKEAQDFGDKGKFVPHNIKLKMQWDKFSTDSEIAIESLRRELHVASIDHINDMRYYTNAPINLEIKPDYFIEGVKLFASFEAFDEDQAAASINVTVPDLRFEDNISAVETEIEAANDLYVVHFEIDGKRYEVKLTFAAGDRKSVGRTKENDLAINETSVSKVHAALVLNSHNSLMVADTGSTNGTFVNGQRIAYGRAVQLKQGDVLKFGSVDAEINHIQIEKREALEISENVHPLIPASDKLAPWINDEGSAGQEINRTGDLSEPIAETEVAERVNLDSMDFAIPDPIKLKEELGVKARDTEQGIVLDFGETDNQK